jgi:hypothetical protein
MPDPAGVVERESRLEASKTGCDELQAAGEACEEVRLDEAGRDPTIRLDPLAAKPHRHVRVSSEPADPRQRRGISRVVVDGPDALDEIVSEHLPKLFLGIS